MRVPYVGVGPEGARRSAQIDRDELATLPTRPRSQEERDRRARLEHSAGEWEAQAAALEQAYAEHAEAKLAELREVDG